MEIPESNDIYVMLFRYMRSTWAVDGYGVLLESVYLLMGSWLLLLFAYFEQMAKVPTDHKVCIQYSAYSKQTTYETADITIIL